MLDKRTATIGGLGLDIAPIARIAKLVDRCDRETLSLLFTSSEIDLCLKASDPHEYYTLCFATKEAVGKALGTGLVGIGWNEIEAKIIDNRLSVHLYGKASDRAKRRGVKEWLANWCRWDRHVLVRVLAL
jgi:holo-[acyl-carrier protein] synthase